MTTPSRFSPEVRERAVPTIERPRVLVQITPARWRTWTGREWHPRYR
jgi:hypothetical protein